MQELELTEREQLATVMSNRMGLSWYNQLEDFILSDDFELIRKTLIDKSETETIYPIAEDAYNAFRLSPFENTNVVLLGQD